MVNASPFLVLSTLFTAVVSTVTLHDVAGRLVKTLYDGPVQRNEQHWVTIDGADLSSGLYFYRVEGFNFTDSRSVTLQK